MAFQLSPGVNVSEVDLTTVIPSVLTTAGAFAGNFVWGPANKVIRISDENSLVRIFGKPDTNTATSFFSAASFLAYGNNLQVVRAVGPNTYNATANSQVTGVQIQNEDVFETTYLTTTNANQLGAFAAKYAGSLGNSLTVSIVDSAQTFANWTVNGIGVSSNFTGAPGTSAQAEAAGGSDDEVHIIVTDSGGLFTGVKDTILEIYQYLSKASDSTDALGNSNYYKNVLYNNSKYVYAVDPAEYSNTSSTWGGSIGTEFATLSQPQTYTLSRGADSTVTTGALNFAYDFFSQAEAIDISLVITGDANTTVQQNIIDNIANGRKDCVAFISPPSSAVINQADNETANIQTWLNSLNRSSSYVMADCGWKYMFDKYNNTYRYVPLNGDIAGLCVNTDSVRDPWFSPAGFNRGNLKNVVKLAWNPNKTARDTLYSAGVNPVGSFPGNGTVLYGDKTLQTKPSAFDRINVRRLFIVLEKAIAQAAKYSMFEFNDEFTRAQFVALVTPFLRDIQGRRGIYDFRVVCDITNNTPEVIDGNKFVGDIYIKPARAINFIQLNFVAVRTGVEFTEVVGKF